MDQEYVVMSAYSVSDISNAYIYTHKTKTKNFTLQYMCVTVRRCDGREVFKQIYFSSSNNAYWNIETVIKTNPNPNPNLPHKEKCHSSHPLRNQT